MSSMIGIGYSADRGGLIAYATCKFCGDCVARFPAQQNPDAGAEADAFALAAQHQQRCPKNPNREKGGISDILEQIYGPDE